jgi:hypothetical protein
MAKKRAADWEVGLWKVVGFIRVYRRDRGGEVSSGRVDMRVVAPIESDARRLAEDFLSDSAIGGMPEYLVAMKLSVTRDTGAHRWVVVRGGA